jgi:hypothetical protein
MKLSLFYSFKDMIEVIPVRAIRRTFEREQQMLAEDIACQRPLPMEEAASILNFCLFVQSISEGQSGEEFAAFIPAHHQGFYRKTLGRLVAAGELPANAVSEFDQAFANDDTSVLAAPADSFSDQRTMDHLQ